MTRLNRTLILDAAMQMADAQGLEGISQRKLARELGVSAMATYRHFADKQTLLEALLDHAIDAPALVARFSRCKKLESGAVGFFSGVRDIFSAHPTLVPLAGTPASLGPSAIEVLQRWLAWQRERDDDPERCALRTHACISYTLGHCVMATAATNPKVMEVAQERLTHTTVEPSTLEVAPVLMAFGSGALFESGLRRVLEAYTPEPK